MDFICVLSSLISVMKEVTQWIGFKILYLDFNLIIQYALKTFLYALD
jgi:hypothetical protein